ncbi:MAG: hypothetical protein R2811_15575 [Flavobacteriales bacterium]
MMHHRSTTLLFSLFMISALSAQGDKSRIKVRMGMEGAGDARLSAVGVTLSSSSSVLVQRQEVNEDGVVKGQLDLYDRAKLGFVRSQPPVEKLRNGAKVVPDRVVSFGDRILMVSRGYGQGKTALHYQILDANLTRLPPPYEALCEWPLAMPVPTTAEPGNFNYLHAADSSLLLMQGPMVQVGAVHKAALGVWGRDFTMRWQQVLAGAEGSIRSAILDAAIDTAGSAYVLVSDRMAKSELLDGKQSTRITLYRVTKDSTSILPVRMPREKFLTHAVLRQLPDGRLVLGGVYGLVKDDRIMVQGDLVALIGPDGQLGEPQMIPHSDDGALIGEGEPPAVEGQKFLEKDVERLMTGIRLVDVLPRSNGGWFLVKELYFMETYFDLKAKRQANRYVHGPVQVTTLGKGGSVEWNTLFRRWYKSAVPGTGEVLCGVYADELFLFVLDSEEQAAARKAGGKMNPDMTKDAYSTHVSFDAKGAARTKAVLRSGNETGYITGQKLWRVTGSEYYTIGAEKPEGGRSLPVRIELSTETR